MIIAHVNVIIKTVYIIIFMQYGSSAAHIASQNGHTETLAFLLANNADVNRTDRVY